MLSLQVFFVPFFLLLLLPSIPPCRRLHRHALRRRQSHHAGEGTLADIPPLRVPHGHLNTKRPLMPPHHPHQQQGDEQVGAVNPNQRVFLLGSQVRGAGKGVEDGDEGGGDVSPIDQAGETQPVLAQPEAVDGDKEKGELEEQLTGHDGLEPLGRVCHEEVPKLFGVPGEQVLACFGVEGGGDPLGVDQQGDRNVGEEVDEENPPQQGGHAAAGCAAAARSCHAPLWFVRVWVWAWECVVVRGLNKKKEGRQR